jgi:hypothetical protein
MQTNRSSAASERRLVDKSVLVSIAPARGRTPIPLALSAMTIGLWRDLQWPVVHFIPDYVRDADRRFPGRGLIQPGALWFESETSSIWSCQRFREFHEDIGSAPIVLIGGEIDKSMLSAAIGAVERNVSVFYLPSTAGMLTAKLQNGDAKSAFLSIISHFAIELTVDDLFDSLNTREEGNYASSRQLRP